MPTFSTFRAGCSPKRESKLSLKVSPLGVLERGLRHRAGFLLQHGALSLGTLRKEAPDTEPARGGVDAPSRVSSAGNVSAATTRTPRKRVSSYGGLGRSKLPPTDLTQVSTEELTNSGEQGDKAEKRPFEQSQGKPAHCFESRGTGFFFNELLRLSEVPALAKAAADKNEGSGAEVPALRIYRCASNPPSHLRTKRQGKGARPYGSLRPLPSRNRGVDVPHGKSTERTVEGTAELHQKATAPHGNYGTAFQTHSRGRADRTFVPGPIACQLTTLAVSLPSRSNKGGDAHWTRKWNVSCSEAPPTSNPEARA